MKKIVNTKSAPQAIGPYSQAIKKSNTLYTSGQIAINPETGELETGNIASETHRVMSNLKSVLSAADMDLTNVVKTSIFLKDMGDFDQVNEVYASYFSSDFPARETVQVAALPKNVNVEISMIAIED